MNSDTGICYVTSVNRIKWNPTGLLLYKSVENLSFFFVNEHCGQMTISEFLAKKLISILLLGIVTSNTAKILAGQSRENYMVSSKWMLFLFTGLLLAPLFVFQVCIMSSLETIRLPFTRDITFKVLREYLSKSGGWTWTSTQRDTTKERDSRSSVNKREKRFFR